MEPYFICHGEGVSPGVLGVVTGTGQQLLTTNISFSGLENFSPHYLRFIDEETEAHRGSMTWSAPRETSTRLHISSPERVHMEETCSVCSKRTGKWNISPPPPKENLLITYDIFLGEH